MMGVGAVAQPVRCSVLPLHCLASSRTALASDDCVDVVLLMTEFRLYSPLRGDASETRPKMMRA